MGTLCSCRQNNTVETGSRNINRDNLCVNTISFEDELLTGLSHVDYRFENIVFAGGGNRIFAYAGAIEILEKVGIAAKIKRFSGTSLGSMVAAFLALGIDSHNLSNSVESIRVNLKHMLYDANHGYLSLFRNLRKTFGWHPANDVMNWCGEKMEEYGSSRNESFLQLYERTGRELCVVVTNVSGMCVEYCHLKTTPDLPIFIALRMSISIPLLLTSVKYKMHETEDIFVDGSIMCNYPIHCFDGWWLSIKTKDTVMKRAEHLNNVPNVFEKNEKFGTFNDQTLGLYLFKNYESNLMEDEVSNMYGRPPVVPDTQLARERGKVGTTSFANRNKCILKSLPSRDNIFTKWNPKKSHKHKPDAFYRFIGVIASNISDIYGSIDKKVLIATFQDKEFFSPEEYHELFGDTSVEDVIDLVYCEDTGRIQELKLREYAVSQGVHMKYHFHERKHIECLETFLATLLSTINNHAIRASDSQRTIAIDTVYLNSSDFYIEAADRDFLYQQGQRAAIVYLKQRAENMDRKGDLSNVGNNVQF